MRRIWSWFAAAPLVFGLATAAQAGIFCGGCSDPCGGSSRASYGTRSQHGCGLFSGCCLGRSARMSQYYGNGYSNSTYYGGGYSGGSYYGVASGYQGLTPSTSAYGVGPACAAPSYSTQAYATPSYVAPSYAAPSYAAQSYAAPSYATQEYSTPSYVAPQIQEQLAAPITTYQVSMQPTYVTETQMVATTQYRDETRYRVKKVYRSMPIEEQRYRMKTLMIPKTETKTIEYEVLIPETTQKSVELATTVPVWNEVTENYTVKVPTLVDVSENYTVKVPSLRDEPFSYTVQVPTPEKSIRTQTVTNAVPVTKTRTVQRSVPRTSSRTVQKDYGHWETVIDETSVGAFSVQASSSVPSNNVVMMGGCGTASSYYSIGQCGISSNSSCATASAGRACGCGHRAGCAHPRRSSCGCGSTVSGCGIATSSSCGVSSMAAYAAPSNCNVGYANSAIVTAPATQTRRVWVPNVVSEEVAVIENDTVSEEVAYTVYEQHSQQIQYEHTSVVYRPEVRTGTKKVVDYVDEQRTRTRKQVEYRDESRTRVNKVLSYKQETKTETYPVVTYRTEKRTKEISFTVQVPEVQAEAYTTTRYEQVAEDVVEEYTVKVPVPSYNEVQVQVCKMVPTLVPVTIQPRAISNYVAPAQPTVTLIGNGNYGTGYGPMNGAYQSNVQSFPFIQSGCNGGGMPSFGNRMPSCNCPVR